MLVVIVDYTSLFSYVYTLILIMLVNRITKEANGISLYDNSLYKHSHYTYKKSQIHHSK